MKNISVIAVEDVNAGYNQGEAVQLTAAETASILELVLATAMERPVVVDVGASNVSNFFAALAGYDGIHEFIDRVIVPAEPSDKVQTDTVSTLHYLIDKLGFDASKIMLLLNKVPTKRTSDAVFGNLMNEAAGMGVLTYGEIPESDTFALAASMKKSIYDLAAMDPKKLLAESQLVAASGKDPKAGVRNMLAATSAKKLKVRLDEIFEALGIPEGEV
ncbi:hypothetical protein AS149_13245 [Burkholderia cenocepacia]|nr:hypothetical protein AS149_13245 [Burkholderia cenocepacia]